MMTVLFAVAVLASPAQAALKGNDPVELCKGNTVVGKADLTHKHGLYTYQFSNQDNLDAFKKDPERWGIQLGGACGNMGPLSGRGDAERYWVYKGRIWIFASELCRATFSRDPENFLDMPDAPLKATVAEQKAARAILDKVVEAHGGWKAISGIKTFVWEYASTYKGSGGKDATYTETFGMQHPGVFYSGSAWETGSGYNYGTMKEGWGYDAIDKFALVKDELTYLQRNTIKHPILLLRASRDFAFAAKLAGQVKAEGLGTCDAVQVHTLGKTVTLLIDAKTHRIVGTQSRDRTGGPYRMVTRTWSDPKPVAGVLVPMTSLATYEGMKREATPRTYSSVRINDSKDAKLFVKPTMN